MLETIKNYEAEKLSEIKHTTFVKSDDGTLVFFKDYYNEDTGEKLANEVIKTMTEKEIQDEIVKKQEEITILQTFLTEIK